MYTVLESNRNPIWLKFHVSNVVVYQKKPRATNKLDPVLKYPLYDIQKLKELCWIRIFPINFVDHILHVYFVHNCTSTYTTKHDETN
ncbi:37109_t:CDS:2 [Gigaspora margarita]|uniref:37109_t:CDS:1 n=1 Tax=Gigaspora margarita TaxID=4874 RepID=A0ABN7UE22_GIGMA|nr:37109_t:CDS:2 [Gigaspora margarita]